MNTTVEPQNRGFAVWETIGEGWGLVAGGKWPIWAIAILIGAASFVVQLLLTLLFRVDPQNVSAVYRFLIMPCISSIVIAPFYAGAVMVGITRARGNPVEPKSGYQYFEKTIPVMLIMFVVALLANIMMYIVHLPSIVSALGLHVGWLELLAGMVSAFVYVFSLLSIPLIVDKNLTPFQALKTSYEIIKHCWLKVFVLLIVLYLFLLIAMIPFFVGSLIHPYARLFGIAVLIVALIWLVPLLFYVEGVLYHKLVDSPNAGEP